MGGCFVYTFLIRSLCTSRKSLSGFESVVKSVKGNFSAGFILDTFLVVFMALFHASTMSQIFTVTRRFFKYMFEGMSFKNVFP